VLPITKVCFVDREMLCRVVQRRVPGMKIAVQGQQHFMKRLRADLDLRDLKSTASTLHQSHSNISQSYSHSCSTTTRSSAGRLPCRSRAQHLMAFGCFHRRSQVVEQNASHRSGSQRDAATCGCPSFDSRSGSTGIQFRLSDMLAVACRQSKVARSARNACVEHRRA